MPGYMDETDKKVKLSAEESEKKMVQSLRSNIFSIRIFTVQNVDYFRKYDILET